MPRAKKVVEEVKEPVVEVKEVATPVKGYHVHGKRAEIVAFVTSEEEAKALVAKNGGFYNVIK